MKVLISKGYNTHILCHHSCLFKCCMVSKYGLRERSSVERGFFGTDKEDSL